MRAAALALGLAMQLLGGVTPSHVLCVHHDGDVVIERAAAMAIRCHDTARPCAAPGLSAGPDEEQCHDAAIAQPGIGQRAAAAASAPSVLVARTAPPLDALVMSSVERCDAPRGSSACARRTVVLRV